MKKPIELIHIFCKASSIQETELLSKKRTGTIVGYRYAFAAVYLKRNHPDLLENIAIEHPVGLLNSIAETFSKSKYGAFNILSKARFYYKTYSDFRTKVENLNIRIDAIRD